MKSKLKIFAVMFLLSVPFAFAGTKVDITVNGMVCPFCAQGITKKFKAKAEVEDVKVVLEDQKVHLQLKDGMDIPDTEITKTLKKAGYSVEKIERLKS